MAEQLGLADFLLLGKGLLTHQHIPSSILAGVFESVVAAVYLDGGHEVVRAFVERAMAPELDLEIEPRLSRNYKSMLQQMSQKQFGATPLYQVLDEKGPDHFEVLQDFRGDRLAGLSGRVGREQERSRAAGGAATHCARSRGNQFPTAPTESLHQAGCHELCAMPTALRETVRKFPDEFLQVCVRQTRNSEPRP